VSHGLFLAIAVVIVRIFCSGVTKGGQGVTVTPPRRVTYLMEV